MTNLETKLAEAQTALLKIAAEIVRGTGMPETDTWRWPARASQRLWRDALNSENAALDQCRLWAIALKGVADSLAAYEREKAEQAPMVAGFVCKECGKPAMRAVVRDPFGKSDARDWWCNDHGPRTFIGTQP